MRPQRAKEKKQVVKLASPKPFELDPKTGAIALNVENILRELGEDPARDGLLRTPARAEKALRFLTSGYDANLAEIVNNALFDVESDGMVIVKNIEFYSMCEHHMLPFYGRMHVAYLPKGKVIGLSKIPRIVDMYSRRLQVQERLTMQVAEAIYETVEARGVGVISESRHFCMMMRGVEKQCSDTVSSAMLGAFRTGKATRDEFLSLVRMRASGDY